MTIRDSEKSSTLGPASMEMLELSADDLGKVAGGATVYYVMRPMKVIGKRPTGQLGGGLNLSQ